MIKVFKCMNGEEIIGDVIDTCDDGWKVKKPMILHVQNGPGGMQAGFAPALMMSEAPVILYKTSIMMDADPSLEFEKRYLEMTSGITLATTLHG